MSSAGLDGLLAGSWRASLALRIVVQAQTAMAEGNLRDTLKTEQLAELREKTEAVSGLLLSQLRGHLDTIRPLLAPRRLLGDYVRSPMKEDVIGADVALKRLREKYKEICGKPFALPPELDEATVAMMESRLELYPWEYAHEAKNEKESKAVTMTSPVRWALTYMSGYTLSQLRQAVAGKAERRQEDVRQFLVNALVMQYVIAKFPGITRLFNDLRYDIQLETCSGLGDLPLVTITSVLPSFRPTDDVLLGAIRLSGVPAFVELIDFGAVAKLEDRLKLQIEEKLRG
jgi:hypothetical protein